MAVAVVVSLASTDWGSYDGAFLAASLVLLLVGFTEEIATRGLLIVALRSRFGEGWVWFISSAAFAAMHFKNFFVGQDLLTTLQQVVFAFLVATVFYILRRTTGMLVFAMVLHALWDFSVFAVQHGAPGPLAGLAGTIMLLCGILSLICVAFVIRGSDERIAVSSERLRA